MIPVRVAQERNTRNAADSTKRRHCGAHRMDDEVGGGVQARLGRLQTILDEDLSPAERDQPTANQDMRSRIDKSVLQSPCRGACVTRLTCGSWPNSLAWSADASPAMPTICGSRNPAVSASRSATNYSTAVPGTPSRTASRRQGNGLVGESRSRTHQPGAQALAGNPPAPRFCRCPGRRQREARSGERSNGHVTAAARAADGETNPVAGHPDMTSLRQINPTAATPKGAPARRRKAAKRALPRMPFAMD